MPRPRTGPLRLETQPRPSPRPLSPQLVGGELERLQPHVRRGHAEPGGPVHAAHALQIRAGLGQPVSTARPLQPTGLPASELPPGVEHWALGRGKWGRGLGGMGEVVSGVPPVQCGVWGQLESPRPRGSGLEPQLGPIPSSREPTLALPARSAHEPAGRAGGRGRWPVRAPTPRPGRSCCRTPSAPRSRSPGLTRPVCSGAATSTRSCSGSCPPGPRWVHLPRWVCQVPGRRIGPR